jgi:hypothetical protein
VIDNHTAFVLSKKVKSKLSGLGPRYEVVVLMNVSVDELVLRCVTNSGVVEERLEQDANKVLVRRRFARHSALTHRIVFSCSTWV